MSEAKRRDCIYWKTGCGQPSLKPRSSRQGATDFYYHSWCPRCHDYVKADKPSMPAPARQQYVKPAQVPQNKYQSKSKTSYTGLR